MKEGLVKPGNAGCTVVDGNIVYLRDGGAESVVPAEDIPVTLGGAARYQISKVGTAATITTRPAATVR